MREAGNKKEDKVRVAELGWALGMQRGGGVQMYPELVKANATWQAHRLSAGGRAGKITSSWEALKKELAPQEGHACTAGTGPASCGERGGVVPKEDKSRIPRIEKQPTLDRQHPARKAKTLRKRESE